MRKILIALFFIMVVGFNSLGILEKSTIESINFLDTFALTMAMSALGMETSIDKFKNSGIKPFYLSFILFIFNKQLDFVYNNCWIYSDLST